MKVFQDMLARLKKPLEGARTCNHRGKELLKSGQFDQALADFDRAIALKPDDAEAFYNRGIAFKQLHRFDEALASYARAIALKPDFAQAFNNRGNLLFEMESFEEALADFDRAIALRPDFAVAFKNRGLALKQQQRPQEALASFDQALALRPSFASAHYSRGNILREMNRFDEALASFNAAVAHQPDFADARKNRGMLLLLLGRYAQGWTDYAWRKAERGKHDKLTIPPWQGESLAGRRILVSSEQGLGDCIQFARYLPLLVRRGADVTCLIVPKMFRLLRSLDQRINFTAAIEQQQDFDFHCGLLSLPRWFETDLATIPADIPYLAAEDELVSRWKERLGVQGFKVGINWQGAAGIPGRSLTPGAFAPLGKIPGVRLISLQKLAGPLPDMPADAQIETLGDFDSGQDAFVDTAAVIANLDLVITCDTSIAHLAGALGRPAWVALKSDADWRWLLERSDSPWYPTMRLVRQPQPGDWDTVVRQMAEDLSALVNG